VGRRCRCVQGGTRGYRQAERADRDVDLIRRSRAASFATSAGDVSWVDNLNGDDPRLTAIEKKYDLRTVDLSKFKGKDFSNHSKFLTAPPQLRALAAAHAGDPQESAFNKGDVVVHDAANCVLQLPDAVGSGLTPAQ
jgi:esterase/lipase superfamily enzyme